jgi:probable phosphoglycerate mutase
MDFPELYILRHGQTEWNAEDRMQGWLNSPLTPQGLREAARQHDIMRQRDLTGFQVLSSPSGRAFQTAAIALGSLVDTIHTDLRLREIDVGDWAGQLRAGLPKADGPDAYLKQYEAAPKGEGLVGLRARVQGFLGDLVQPSVLVTHGITGLILRQLLIGDAAMQGLGPDDGPNGGQGMVFHLKDGAQTLLR